MSSPSRRASPSSPTPTLPGVVVRSLRVPAAFAVGAAAVLSVGGAVGGSMLAASADDTRPGSEVVAEQGAATPLLSTSQRLLRRHDCWTGEAPVALRGELPGHVVLSHRAGGEVVTTYGGEVWVGRALEELFGDGDPRVLTVHGFCR